MKKIVIIIGIFMIILLSATIFSVVKFKVWNPFSAYIGMIEILATNKEYSIVQNNPCKVILSKTADTSSKGGKQYLDEYMESRGFYFVPEEQMGATLIYSNGDEKEHIVYSTNKYYSKWEWQ